MTTTAQATADQEERIVRLFAEGYGIDFVCERGLVAGTNGWNRARVLEVVSRRGWTLDGTGRVPREHRPAITPGQPVPRTASGKTPIGAVGGGPAAVVPVPRPSPGRGQIAALLERHPEDTIGAYAALAGPAVAGQLDQAVAEAATKTPTEKGPEPTTSEPVGTAPSADAGVTGRRAPDAAPQVSPSRTRTEDGGGRGASDAPAALPAATPATGERAAEMVAAIAAIEDDDGDEPIVELPPPANRPGLVIGGPSAVTTITVHADPAASPQQLAADIAWSLRRTNTADTEPPILMAPVADSADRLLERATTHTDPGIRDHARRATLLLEQIRAALARDDERTHLQARLAELDAERDALLARLAEPLLPEPAPVTVELALAADALAAQLDDAGWPDEEPAEEAAAAPTPAVADTTGSCGTWGGFLKHRYRGDTVEQIEADCPPCYAAKATRGRTAAS